MVVQISKPILVILLLIAAVAVVGLSLHGKAAHPHEAGVAALIGLAAIIAGLLPVRFAADRTTINLFQSAWIGSILHLTVFLALGGTALFVWKSSTAFVVWLLAAYWLTLIALCAVMVKTLRGAVPQLPGALTTQRVSKGE